MSTALSLALMRARWWVETFSQYFVVRGLVFHAPHVTVSPEDEIVLEWWSDDRKLTLYVTSARVDYVRVWGHNIVNDMEDGSVVKGADAVRLWRWLTTGE